MKWNNPVLAARVRNWALKIHRLPTLSIVQSVKAKYFLQKKSCELFKYFASKTKNVSFFNCNQCHTKARKRQWAELFPRVSVDVVSFHRTCHIFFNDASCNINEISHRAYSVRLPLFIQVSHPLHKSCFKIDLESTFKLLFIGFALSFNSRVVSTDYKNVCSIDLHDLGPHRPSLNVLIF
jgi:hypothetical protein